MPELGIHCVRRVVSGADLTDFGRAACVSLLLALSCVLSPAFAQASPVACPVGSQVMTGSGTESIPYQVTDICQLQGISSRPAAYYVLMDNIDASETEGWNGGKGFRPIASTATDGFSGSFVNPGSYVISLLTISRSTETYVGLFSRLAAGATIRGVILVGSRTTGRDSVGSLVGYSDGVTDNNSATGPVTGRDYVGGLVGWNQGRINNGYAMGSVAGRDYVGGLVGRNLGSITDGYAMGSASGQFNVGGLVGSHSPGLFISDSYATGSVFGLASVGGLVGWNEGHISKSYATGSVFGSVGNVGGLAGYQRSGSSISDSYATGSVIASGSNVGGLAGWSEGTIYNGYATGSVSGQGDHVGGLVGRNRGTSAILDSYYAARGQNNDLGEERTFAQLRCPMAAGATCPLNSQGSSYQGWSTSVWVFGSTTTLPQLSSNQNSDLNLKPYIKGSTELMVRLDVPGVTRFPLEADYSGPPGEPVTLTWSLLGVPPLLHHLVHFELGDGTTGTTFADSAEHVADFRPVTLVVVSDDELTGNSFDVVLKNNVSASFDRLAVRAVGASPLLFGGTEQIRIIQDVSDRAILRFSASDPDRPNSGGIYLSWKILRRDIAEGSTVEFSDATKGGNVEVEVIRDSLGSVGSLVMEVESTAGVKTTFTVTIETGCSTVPGVDLMAGQTGMGTIDDPYQIKRLCQLQDISSRPVAHYELAADIDASKTKDWNEGAGFEPIAGGDKNIFVGSFVGTRNYVISSLTINRGSMDNVGLFSELTSNATIRGIILVGSRTIGYNNVGSLAGNNAGVIVNCSATGSVSGQNEVGGLVGNNLGSIGNSYAASTVTGYSLVGGVVGAHSGSSEIKDSSATSTVFGQTHVGGLVGSAFGNIINSYATGSVFGRNIVGGLVGTLQTGSSVPGISGSYATGSVSGTGGIIGGLVGTGGSDVSNSYATGSVSGQGNHVGGLVGYQRLDSSVSNSYATGSVSGGNHVGGLVGYQRFGSSVSNSYATGSVSGGNLVGGLVGASTNTSANRNSYYAARGRYNGLGEERTFAQLRCPTMPGETCPSDSPKSSYQGWDTSVWDFGSTTTLPQLSRNQNSGLNLKPYIKGSTELVVRLGVPGVTRFSLEAGYSGPPGESVNLMWSLLFDEESSMLSDLVYFDLGADTTSTGASGSFSTLVVVRDYRLTAVKGFNVVLRSDISADHDRVRVRVERSKEPRIFRNDDIRQAEVEGITTFSFSVDYTGSPDPVTLTWSLSGVPTTLSHLVYFDFGGGTTSTTFTDSAKLTNSASPVTLVVVGDEGLADKSFYVVLRNDISAEDDRVRVQVEESKQPRIFPNVIDSAEVEGITTFSFSVGYAGPPGAPVTLTWSLSGVPTTLSHLVYFDFGGGTTSTTFTDSAKLTNSASPVTLVVVGDEGLAGKSFYVVLRNDISANGDRIRVQVEESKQPRIFLNVIDSAKVEGITTFSFSVDYAGPPGVPVTLTWSLSGVPTTLSHLVYFDFGGGTTSTTFTDSAKLTNSASPVTLVVVGDEGLAGKSFYVVLRNDISANGDRIRVQVEESKQPRIFPNVIDSAEVEGITTFSFSVGYAGPPGVPVTLTWSLFGVPVTLSHLVYFDFGGGTTSTTFTDSAKLTNSASPVTLVVVGDEGLAGKSFYVVLRNDISANGDRVRVQVEESKQPRIFRNDDIRQAEVEGITTFSFSVGYAGPPGVPVTLTWSLFGVPVTLSHLVYFDFGGGTTSTTFTDSAKLTNSASPVTLVVVGDEGLAGKSFYVVLRNDISANGDRVRVRVQSLIPGLRPLVGPDGRNQIVMIWEGLTSTILSFSATDQDNPAGSVGLLWDIPSRDGIAEGSSVVFSGTTKGSVVKVEVRRTLDLYDVGSFVLGVTSSAGVKTTTTVTIKTACSLEPGADLMSRQTGTGKPDNPYQIERLCQLQDVSSSPSAHYELAADIDGNIPRVLNGGTGFEPIASGEENGFSGSFVSTHTHMISSLTISRSGTNNVGLFSKLAEGATIRGVILAGSRMTGRNSVGLLVGFSAGVIESSSATGSVSGRNRIGGLVGYSKGSIRDSHAASTVTSNGFFVGGLVGDNRSDISGSYATGFVSGDDYVGGLVGSNDGNIDNGYATASVFGIRQVGGFVGRNEEGASISRSYADSTVKGRDDVGGLVGFSEGGEGNIANSYYTGQDQEKGWGELRTYQQLACPPAPDAMPGGTCMLPAATYVGWSERVWDFTPANELPKLRPGAAAGGAEVTPAMLLRVRVYLGGAVR